MRIYLVCIFLGIAFHLSGKNIYIDGLKGSNNNDGRNINSAYLNLSALDDIKWEAGDSLLLAGGHRYKGMIDLEGVISSEDQWMVITSYGQDMAIIDGSGYEAAIRIKNSRSIKIYNVKVTANGGRVVIPSHGIQPMRCGILFLANKAGDFGNLVIDKVDVFDIFYGSQEVRRSEDEVRTANGTQPYGWGIRIINSHNDAMVSDVNIVACKINNTGHTGLKLTSSVDWSSHRIHTVNITDCEVRHTGGPGIQMSGVRDVMVSGNTVDHSGSTSDTRKWGRGSGLWTWGSKNIQIQKNRFTNANGPADSAGVHIDFNCSNVVIQYNLSMNNAGGFCEILGNNYNCCYRYNISVNDGHRIKGESGAFQEGKIFWLSGYSGKGKKRNGPFNSYFYNNTIIVQKGIQANIAVANTSEGVLIANNIFHIEGESSVVLGDQYQPEQQGDSLQQIPRVIFSHNLFLRKEGWPENVIIQPKHSFFGDAEYNKVGKNLLGLEHLMPQNHAIVKDKGIIIQKIPFDEIGLEIGLDVERDILGNKVVGLPDLGAIEVK
ncbi:right-handed parallel beta-helix repeat-containing protein [Portibacter marinus]|uniref:right-handed parallel beta-helix repeat-containing protein n=1 Tax=Portibacter marinus TaxID=2898660 RepID=UPI001F2E6CAD|nr:right-handed parallel beta-helix repeat-containing protein [Portibacter marinus]